MLWCWGYSLGSCVITTKKTQPTKKMQLLKDGSLSDYVPEIIILLLQAWVLAVLTGWLSISLHCIDQKAQAATFSTFHTLLFLIVS